jgi:uncharacterized repeat protein (TIGR03803 family)
MSSPTIIVRANFGLPTTTQQGTRLTSDTTGDLFGAKQEGGASGDGMVFEVKAGSNTFTTIASFNGINGTGPIEALISDSAGNLFGMTGTGGPGANSDGTVFEIAAGSNTITTIASFNGVNGSDPRGSLLLDSTGDLFGATGGAGTVFEIAAGSNTITTIASFNGVNGSGPNGGLIADGAGNLFGTTNTGGPNDDGTVFEIAAGSNTITTIASFNGVNGSFPVGGLILDRAANLFGTTETGGANNDGTVFEIAAGSNTITTIASFNGANGLGPLGSLIADAAENLFGTTEAGGANNDGTVFEIAAGSDTITTIASFDFHAQGPVGPNGALIADSAGDLFGTTGVGGSAAGGTVFEVTGSGFLVPPCFGAGTRISTERGEVAVEALRVGDRVQVVVGGTQAEPVVWLGHRTVDCARHPEPHKVWPVRVSAHAFGANRPCRDLYLSPDHAVYVGDALIPVKHLVNGTSIRQVPRDEVTYHHVELPRHSVLLAEGLAAESYLDTGDRSNFANNAGPVALYPDFASRAWDAAGCAPLVVTGPALDAARRWSTAWLDAQHRQHERRGPDRTSTR